jgi:hypothetical protein
MQQKTVPKFGFAGEYEEMAGSPPEMAAPAGENPRY